MEEDGTVLRLQERNLQEKSDTGKPAGWLNLHCKTQKKKKEERKNKDKKGNR